jgi:hypothetical protein
MPLIVKDGIDIETQVFSLFRRFCKPCADSDNNTMSSAFWQQHNVICILTTTQCHLHIASKKLIINRKALLCKLQRYNIRGCFYNILENMHNNVTFSVNLSDGLTDTFKSSIGVKQGCILTHTIFSLYIGIKCLL